MAEKSIFWTTGATGDGASAYTQAELIRWMRQMMLGDNTDEGVHKGYENELEVTGTSTPVAVNTGAALVYGFPYWNTASVNVAVPTPSANTRIDRIVLEVDWTAQTVRITRVAGTEGTGTPPSLTQTDGVTWQISLAQASITTGGVITVTDERVFAHPNIEVEGAMLAAGIVDDSTIEISSNQLRVKDAGVTAAKIANRTREFFVPAVATWNSTDGEAGTRSGMQGWTLEDNHTYRCYGEFCCPRDYASGMTVQAVVWSTTGSGNLYGDGAAEVSADGEPYTQHEYTWGPATAAITAGQNEFIGSISVTGVAVGDIVRLIFTRTGGNASDTVNANMNFSGWWVSYTADS